MKFTVHRLLSAASKWVIRSQAYKIVNRCHVRPTASCSRVVEGKSSSSKEEGLFQRKAMPRYKLIYFDVRGRAELSRLVFAAACVPYEDVRIQINEWITLKHTVPQKVLPVLEVDGVQISQSLTIARFLSREFGLTGSTSLERAQVEELVDCMDDLRAEIAKLIHEKESDKKVNIQTNLYESVYPKFIGILEHYLGENKCNSGYFLGEELTLADLSVFETWTLPLENHPDLFDDHPELLAHRKRIENDERLSHYIKTRPKRNV